MKINRTIITKFAKRFVRRHQGLHQPQLMHPEREWFIGLAVAILLVIGSGAWSANTYLAYESVDADSIEDIPEPVVVYRESLVAAAQDEFAKRAQVRESILGTVPPEPEPVAPVATATPTTTEESFEPVATSSELVATSTPTTTEEVAPSDDPDPAQEETASATPSTPAALSGEAAAPGLDQ